MFISSNNQTDNWRTQWIPINVEENIIFDESPSNTRKLNITLSETSTNPGFRNFYSQLAKNETLYLHALLMKQSESNKPIDQIIPMNLVHIVRNLNKFKYIKPKKLKNLLSSPITTESVRDNNNNNNKNSLITGDTEGSEVGRYGSFWNPEIYLALVNFHETLPNGMIPSHVQPQLTFDQRNESYWPIFYVNDLWTLEDSLLELHNNSIRKSSTDRILSMNYDEIPLYIEFYVMSFWKWQLNTQMAASFEMNKKIGSVTDEDDGEVKRMLLETNPYLLALTMIVSLLHTIFDFLAFKNDIQFWREKQTMEGVSVKTLFINFGIQLVIILYLFDNDTSWLILGSSFVGIVIEAWKIGKAVNFKKIPTFPYYSFEEKETYIKSKTKEYDDEAITYLSFSHLLSFMI